ncbi:MAG: hypothetical protein ACFFDT_37620, partial [Candidatus Hodarchaeota archaeon]
FMNAGIEFNYSGLICKLRFVKTLTDESHFQYTPFILVGDVYYLSVFTAKDAYSFSSLPPNFVGDVGEAFMFHNYTIYARLTTVEIAESNYTVVGVDNEVIKLTLFNSTYSQVLGIDTTNVNGTILYNWNINSTTNLTNPGSEGYKIRVEWFGSTNLTKDSLRTFDVMSPFGISVGSPFSTMAKDHEYAITVIPYERWFNYDISTILDSEGNPSEALLLANYNQTVTAGYRIVDFTDFPGTMEVVMYYNGTVEGPIHPCNASTLPFTIRYDNNTTTATIGSPDTDNWLTFVLRSNATNIWRTNTTQGVYSYTIVDPAGYFTNTTESGAPDNILYATLSISESVEFNITLTDAAGQGSGRFDNGTININMIKTGFADYLVGNNTWPNLSTFDSLNGTTFGISFTWDAAFAVGHPDYINDVTFEITWTDAFGKVTLVDNIDFTLKIDFIP